jgi:hypothetical protein
MNRTFYNFIIIAFAIAVSATFVVSTIGIGTKNETSIEEKVDEVVWNKVTPITLSA